MAFGLHLEYPVVHILSKLLEQVYCLAFVRKILLESVNSLPTESVSSKSNMAVGCHLEFSTMQISR
jgi:hypothetical protein